MKVLIEKVFKVRYLILACTLSISAVLLNSCKKEEEEPPKVSLPSGLTLAVSVDDDNFGFISVRATASNANFYTVIFTEDGTEKIERTNTGEASYTYKKEGTYSIKARAHTSDAEYIEEVKTVTIKSNEPERQPGSIPSSGYTTPLTYAGCTLVWQDEFNGTSLNSSNWVHEIGNGSSGWGNNELQYYREENTSVANGILTITAKRETFQGSIYTSSRIKTQGLQSFQYGRIDIRAAAPYGKGIWPALWMLGDNISNTTWPACGEIDIMEMTGGPTSSKQGDDKVFGTVHWADNDNKHAEFGGNKQMENKLFDNFHVYSLEWDASSIKWYIDNTEFHSIEITESQFDEFRQKFFFIFNVAVGGNWPGSPDATTEFPQSLHVDYIRVFQK